MPRYTAPPSVGRKNTAKAESHYFRATRMIGGVLEDLLVQGILSAASSRLTLRHITITVLWKGRGRDDPDWFAS